MRRRRGQDVRRIPRREPRRLARAAGPEPLTTEDEAIAYRIDSGDRDVVDALRRIARAQLDTAITALEGDLPRAEAVHDARKRLKKVRGLLRLVRTEFPDYAQENRALRDAGRTLAPLRDSDVLVQTFDGLLEGHSDELETGAFAPLREELLAGGEAMQEASGDKAVSDVTKALRKSRKRAGRWFLSETGFDAIAGGLRKTYGRMRQGASLEPGAAPDADLHAWRKAVKYHGYHVRLLRPLWPEALKARHGELDELGEVLGAHQDLAVFEARVRKSALDTAPRRVLLGIVERRKLETARQAHRLGRRLTIDPPKRLVGRWRALWTIWREEETAREG